MKVVLYGLGKDGKIHLEKCFAKNVQVSYICDRKFDEIKYYKGIKVCSPDKLKNEGERVMVVITTSLYYEEIINELKNYSNLILVSMDMHLFLLDKCKDSFDYKNELLKQDEFYNRLDIFASTGKVALFADNIILMPDTNAGNRASLDYLKTLTKCDYKILFYAQDLTYRDRYVDELASDNIFVFWGRERKKYIKQWLKDNKSKISLNFINRPELAVDLEDYLIESHSKLIYFGHDVHHLRLLREYQISKDADVLVNSIKIKNIEESIILKSDLAGYPSYEEVEYIKSWIPSSNVVYFPLNVFKYHSPYDYHPERRQGILFVGGFGHKPNIDAVRWFYESVLPYIRQFGITDKFYIIGSNPTKEIIQMKTDDVQVLGYVSDQVLRDYYMKCRLVVIPLRYGAGMKGKLLEAMNYGTPVVSTAIGVEGLKEYKDCLKTASEDNFASEIINLYNDFDSLRKLSVNSQRYIQDNFGENEIVKVLRQYV